MTEPTTEDEAWREEPAFCPVCDAAVEAGVCSGCHLNWLFYTLEHFEPPGLEPNDEPLELVLRRDAGCLLPTVLFFVLPLGLLGLSAALGSLWNLVTAASLGWNLLAALVGIPLGGWVASTALAFGAQTALQLLWPSRIDGDEGVLRLRTWVTWGDILGGFRRIDVCIPREDLSGVAFWEGQGGHTHLALVHRSGHALETGWYGSRQEAELQARRIHAWLGG